MKWKSRAHSAAAYCQEDLFAETKVKMICVFQMSGRRLPLQLILSALMLTGSANVLAGITYTVNSAQSQLTVSAILHVNAGSQTIHMPFTSTTSPANSLRTSLTGSFTANNPSLGLSIPTLHIAQLNDLSANIINPLGSPISIPPPGTPIGMASIDADTFAKQLRFSMNGTNLSFVNGRVDYVVAGYTPGQFALTGFNMNVIGAPVFSAGDTVVDFNFGTGAAPLHIPAPFNPAFDLEIAISGHVQGIAPASAPEPATLALWSVAGLGGLFFQLRKKIAGRLIRRAPRQRHGATLVEIAAVTLIICILVALVLPAALSIRENARRHHCLNNLRQMGMALHNFHSAKGQFPAGRDAIHNHQHSWTTTILPYVNQEALFHQYRRDVAWDAPQNSAVANSNVPLFLCPSTAHSGSGLGDYGGNYGSSLSGLKPGFRQGFAWSSGTLLTTNLSKSPAKAVAMDEIRDGCSQTLLVVEDAGAPGFGGKWACGHHNVAHDHSPINSQRSLEIFSDHAGGANCLFSDGAVKFLSEEMEPKVIGAISTRNHHEKLSSTEIL